MVICFATPSPSPLSPSPSPSLTLPGSEGEGGKYLADCMAECPVILDISGEYFYLCFSYDCSQRGAINDLLVIPPGLCARDFVPPPGYTLLDR